jgi:hypothetical protein
MTKKELKQKFLAYNDLYNRSLERSRIDLGVLDLVDHTKEVADKAARELGYRDRVHAVIKMGL